MHMEETKHVFFFLSYITKHMFNLYWTSVDRPHLTRYWFPCKCILVISKCSVQVFSRYNENEMRCGKWWSGKVVWMTNQEVKVSLTLGRSSLAGFGFPKLYEFSVFFEMTFWIVWVRKYRSSMVSNVVSIFSATSRNILTARAVWVKALGLGCWNFQVMVSKNSASEEKRNEV